MTAKVSYSHFLSSLKNIYSYSEAASIADMVFESLAGINRASLMIDPERELSSEVSGKINVALDKLLQNMPVQYVLGEAWFYKMKLKVSPTVLIPRPETEELVLDVINYCKEDKAANFLDIGTGSGCIAIAIKKNVPEIKATAIDVSTDAIAIAEENATQQNTEINFLQLNFLEESGWGDLLIYDIIVSNPPYIPLNEKETMDKNVTAYEPHTALFVADETPLIFYEKIALFAKKHLARTGKIFMETHEDLAVNVAALFEQHGYRSAIKKDMFGKERIVTATHSR